jgi:hypothetical protein
MHEKMASKHVKANRAGESDSGDGNSRGREQRESDSSAYPNEHGTVV